MKKKKLSELTKANTLSTSERVIALSSDMKSPMAVIKAALNDNLSYGIRTGFTGNNGHEIYESGITVLLIANGVSLYGFPSETGILLHLQRLDKGQISGSQMINQILLSSTQVYYRSGTGNGTTVIYQSWKTFVFA